MRFILNMSILSMFIAGCGSSVPPPASKTRDPTTEDAASYLSTLKAEFADLASARYSEGGGGQAHNIKTEESSFTVDSSELSADELSAYAERALRKWGEFERFSSRGTGSSGNRFELRFGNRKSHVFVDLIAYPDKAVTKVDCLVRAVE